MDVLLEQQIKYYRARAAEYDQWYLRQGRYDRGPVLNGRWFAQDREVFDRLNGFAPSGSILELACGTGIWTERLLPHAHELLAVDASPEVLAINRARLRSQKIEYIEADMFAWTPPRQFDIAFFGFWLSHVPPDRFEGFWSLVRRALRPGGRFFFVDSRYEPTSTATDHRLPDRAAATLTRRLNDGREFQIYKIHYEAEALQHRLAQLGWSAEIRQTTDYFLYGWGSSNRPG
jgi:demethylmenaquinone methyltransferase/2-methoxy-6-polyprenyl-1,4-benzoquinol methylase